MDKVSPQIQNTILAFLFKKFPKWLASFESPDVQKVISNSLEVGEKFDYF